MVKHVFIIIALLFSLQGANAYTIKYPVVYVDSLGQIINQDVIDATVFKHRPNPVFELFRKKQKLNKKITAAVLAFPFPFGMVGLHRIYMGTKPYIPVVYIATIGGVFGILPFIDFCVLLFDKDFKRYEDNGKVFMWIKN